MFISIYIYINPRRDRCSSHTYTPPVILLYNASREYCVQAVQFFYYLYFFTVCRRQRGNTIRTSRVHNLGQGQFPCPLSSPRRCSLLPLVISEVHDPTIIVGSAPRYVYRRSAFYAHVGIFRPEFCYFLHSKIIGFDWFSSIGVRR